MNPNETKTMSPEEQDALKQEILGVVEQEFSKPIGSKEEVLKTIAEAIGTISQPKELGGMGMNEGMGDMENLAEEGAPVEEEMPVEEGKKKNPFKK
jgi:hypothetical protein